MHPWIPIRDDFIHIIRTGCPRAIHTPHQLSTRCGCRRRRPMHTVRAVSQTPTYDQLRGERINADVPSSEEQPPRLDQPGKHDPLNAPDVLAHAQSRETEAEPVTAWSWFESVDRGPSGRHHLWSEVSAATEVRDPAPAPPACHPRFGAGQAGKVGSVSATGRDESLAPLASGLPGAVPPVAHARHTASHGGGSFATPAVSGEKPTGDRGAGSLPRAGRRSGLGHFMPNAVH